MENELKPSWCQAAELELVYRSKVKASERPLIKSSVDSYELLQKIWNRDKIEMVEEFKVMLMNRGNKVLGIVDIASGGICGTVADVRIILATALKANAVSMILAHNHPSGNIKPSKADEDLTKKIKYAAEFHDIKVLDHIIITTETYFSFADEGLL